MTRALPLSIITAAVLLTAAPTSGATGIETRLTRAAGVPVRCLDLGGPLGTATAAWGLEAGVDTPVIWMWGLFCEGIRRSLRDTSRPLDAAVVQGWYSLGHEAAHVTCYQTGLCNAMSDPLADVLAPAMAADLMGRAATRGARMPGWYRDQIVQGIRELHV